MTEQDKRELSLDRLFVRVVHLHRNRARTLLHGLGLHRGQPGILRLLWEQDGLRQKDIAEKRNLKSATVTRMLQRMEKAGFIVRKQDSEDMRVIRIYLSEKGRAVKEELEAKMRQIEEESFGNFSEEEYQEVYNYLLRMEKNLLEKMTDND